MVDVLADDRPILLRAVIPQLGQLVLGILPLVCVLTLAYSTTRLRLHTPIVPKTLVFGKLFLLFYSRHNSRSCNGRIPCYDPLFGTATVNGMVSFVDVYAFVIFPPVLNAEFNGVVAVLQA